MLKTKTRKTEYLKFGDMVLQPETGEVIPMETFRKEPVEEDVGFVKMWTEMLVKMLTEFGSANDLVAAYLFAAKNKDNIVIATQKQVASAMKISLSQVNAAFKLLKKMNIICQVSPGVLMINPRFFAYGSTKKRAELLKKYDGNYMLLVKKEVYHDGK